MVSLVFLALLILPILPETETASIELQTAEVQNTGTLLGENSPELEVPPEASLDPPTGSPISTMGTNAAGTTADAIGLTVPKLGLKNVAVPGGSSQAELDRKGILRLGGLPWREDSNTFIAGHALGFPRTRVPYAFYRLPELVPGDEILIESPGGREYTFRVYDRLTVEPDDFWVTYPVEGKTVVSLQTCTPIPTFEKRLIVRAELVS
ncbi:MAG: sortase [Rubrobacter sp.]